MDAEQDIIGHGAHWIATSFVFLSAILHKISWHCLRVLIWLPVCRPINQQSVIKLNKSVGNPLRRNVCLYRLCFYAQF